MGIRNDAVLLAQILELLQVSPDGFRLAGGLNERLGRGATLVDVYEILLVLLLRSERNSPYHIADHFIPYLTRSNPRRKTWMPKPIRLKARLSVDRGFIPR